MRIVARGLVAALLNAQLAVAAYACPQVAAAMAAAELLVQSVAQPMAEVAEVARPVVAVLAVAAAMPDCADRMQDADASTATLCAEHCKVGQQSDQMPSLALPAVQLMARYETPFEAQRMPASRPGGAWSSALITAAPPLAVAHCCWRI